MKKKKQIQIIKIKQFLKLQSAQKNDLHLNRINILNISLKQFLVHGATVLRRPSQDQGKILELGRSTTPYIAMTSYSSSVSDLHQVNALVLIEIYHLVGSLPSRSPLSYQREKAVASPILIPHKINLGLEGNFDSLMV